MSSSLSASSYDDDANTILELTDPDGARPPSRWYIHKNDLLGSGASGAVYSGRPFDSAERVAIKCFHSLRPDGGFEAPEAERTVRRDYRNALHLARKFASNNYQHIIPVLAAGEDPEK